MRAACFSMTSAPVNSRLIGLPILICVYPLSPLSRSFHMLALRQRKADCSIRLIPIISSSKPYSLKICLGVFPVKYSSMN